MLRQGNTPKLKRWNVRLKRLVRSAMMLRAV
jgi:hypothetical protein